MEIFDLPFRGGNEDVVNYCPIYHDRLTRLFHYGYYTMKYPIFGMIAPLIVNSDDRNQKYRLSLLNKATGKILYIEDELGDGIYPDKIGFALYKDIKLVREQVNAMFQFEGNKIEPIKEIVLPTGERADVDEAIDKLEAEMERYKFTHKGAPSSYPELAKLIGKYEEYGRLMLRQAVIPRENPRRTL